MDAIDHDNIEAETSPFQEICQRHGEKIHRHHGCPKCVMEEVRRHEMRIHAPLDQEAPIPADSIGKVNPLSVEIG